MSGEAPLILVVGATGLIGSELMNALDGRAHVRALVRSEASARAVAQRHPAVEVMRGDLADAETLASAFIGVGRLFLLTPSVAEQQQLEENALATAWAGGVERVVYMSNNEVGWGIELSRAHRAIEQRLAASQVDHVALRPDYLLDNLLYEVEDLAGGQLTAPSGNARCAFVDARDVGAVAAAALLADRTPRGPLVVTGPEALTWAQLAERLSGALGWNVEHVDPSPSQWAANAAAAGLDPWLADALREYFERLVGETIHAADTVPRMTGAPARTVEQFVRDKLVPAIGERGPGSAESVFVAPSGDAAENSRAGTIATTVRRQHA